MSVVWGVVDQPGGPGGKCSPMTRKRIGIEKLEDNAGGVEDGSSKGDYGANNSNIGAVVIQQ